MPDSRYLVSVSWFHLSGVEREVAMTRGMATRNVIAPHPGSESPDFSRSVLFLEGELIHRQVVK
jgi:hypothetical protein